MMSLWQVPAVFVVFVTWLASPPTDLADAARREALRRHLTRPAATTLSNMGEKLEPIAPVGAAPAPQAAAAPPAGVDDEGVPLPPGAQKPTAAPAAAAQAKPAAAQDDTKKPASANDEKAWRDKMAQARQTLERDETHADAMQTRINSLQTDIVNRDDPAQQAKLREQLAKSLDELDRLKKDIDKDKKAIADIQADARKQGVPPGWVR
jgi:hypothetical protein